MGTINPQIPTVGQPNSTEQSKITSGMGTIRDVINGNLDNDNIAANADIDADKLLDGSVNTAQLADAAVTLAKLATTMKSGNIALGSYVDEVTDYGTIGASQPICQVSSVAPGTYLALATSWRLPTLAFVASSGSASGSGVSTEYGNSLDNASYFFHMGVLIVTATATIDLQASVATTSNSASLLLFGIASGA